MIFTFAFTLTFTRFAMRFRPEQHLRRAAEIRAVREQGRRIDCRAFTVWWKPRAMETNASVSAPAASPRVCVIASTSAVGSAVQRNRAKRRLREVFRHAQRGVPAQCDLLLIARAAVNQWPMPDLEKKFNDACELIARAVPAKA